VQVHAPDDWQDATDIAVRTARRVMVLGPADVGKSSFCRFLIDSAGREGITTALLDADLGQKAVGPPACVSCLDASGLTLVFARTTNPLRGWGPLVDGCRTLARRTHAAQIQAGCSVEQVVA
jgi:polynucleotide 5'-hydroxyl-kinase GRC3/NOL9